jgi:hypothetical protein
MSLQSWLQRFVVRSATAGDPHGPDGETPLAEKEHTAHFGPALAEQEALPATRRVATSLLALILVSLISAAAGALLMVAFLPTRPSGDPATPSRSEPPPPYYPGYPEWLDQRLPLGREACDFALPDVTSGQDVRLSEYRGRKPVVLIFGTTSSALLRNQAGPLEELYQTYPGRAMFLFVHIREAGAVPSAGPAGEQREQVRQALASFPLTMPCVLDGPLGETQRSYQARPQRLVLVGVDGRIALDAGRGLQGGWDLTQVEDWLKEQKP